MSDEEMRTLLLELLLECAPADREWLINELLRPFRMRAFGVRFYQSTAIYADAV